MDRFSLGKKWDIGEFEMSNNKWRVFIYGDIECDNEYLMEKRSLDMILLLK